MGNYKRIIGLVLILAAATTAVLGTAFGILYNISFEEQRARLVNMSHSSGHMMEAVARFNTEHNGDFSEGAIAATISQIKDSHEHFRGFGETGEFVLAQRDGDQIHFLLRHRFHTPAKHRETIPYDASGVEPIQRALSGLTGTVVITDYRGVPVLAAFEPVSFLNLGIVTKMDIAEIRAPFVRAAGIIIGLALLLIITGIILFYRLSSPLTRALRQSQDRYEAIVQGHPEMLCRFLPDGTFTFVNDAFCRFFGKPREELIGQTFAPLVVQEDIEGVEGKIESLSEDSPVTIIKNRVIAAGGETRWTRWANQAIWNDEGHIIEYQSGGHDITEQMQAEENLRKSEEKFRGIFDESVAAIYLFDNEKNFINTNQAGLDLLGYSREELLSMSIPDVDAEPAVVLPTHEQLLSGSKIVNYEHRLKRKDGHIISVLNNSRPLTDINGDVVGLESTLVDITEQKQVQKELKARKEQLQERVKELTGLYSLSQILEDTSLSIDEVCQKTAEIIPPSWQYPEITCARITHNKKTFTTANFKETPWCQSVGIRVNGLTEGQAEVFYTEDRPIFDEGPFLHEERNLINDLAYRLGQELERRKAEERLIYSEARLSHLLISSPAVIYTAAVSGDYAATYISPNVKEMMGLDPQDFLSDPDYWIDHIHPDDAPRVLDDLKGLSERGTHAHSYRFRKPDGSYMWVHDELNLTYKDNGDPDEVVGSWSDITERKKMEDTLRESEEKFRSIYESSTMAMIVAIDHAGTVLSWNPGAEKAFGYTKDEIIGKPLTMIMPERFREAHNEGLQRVASGGKGKIIGKPVEVYGLHKDGHEFPTELTIGTWKSSGTTFFSAVINDITERRLAELHMKEKSQSLVLLQRIAVASNEAVSVEEALQACLDLVCAYTGWPVGHVYLHDEKKNEFFPSMLWHIDDPERFSAFRKVTELTICKPRIGLPGRVLVSGGPEWILDITKDDNFPRATKKDINLRTGIAFPVFVGAGVAAVLEFYTDAVVEPDIHLLDLMGHVGTQLGRVIERERSQKALRQSEEMTRTMLTSAGQGIYATNLDGECIICNPACIKVLGYDDETDLLGKNLHQQIHYSHGDGTPYPEDECRLRQVPLNGKGIIVDDEVFWRADGSSFPVEYRAYPLYRDADIVGTVVTFDDISVRVEIDSKLKQAQKMDAIGHMVGGIAHDFNNLLGIIIGNLELLQRLVGDQEKANARVETALKGARRGANLTQKLLGFSRREPIGAEAQNVNKLIHNSHDLLEKLLVKAIELKLDLVDDPWPTAIDAGDFENAIMNLCVNARDAMPDGGTLVIETAKSQLDEEFVKLNPGAKVGDYVQVSVSDTGGGMPPEIMEQVFEPFFTTKERGRGTGLGLSMIYGFVKRSGGYIKIYSEVGYGTTIKVYLPRALGAEEPVTETDFPVPAAELPRGKETVLVVDDEEDLVDLAVEQLEELGYRTFATINGVEAMKILSSRKKIDLLFSDIIMPGGMNGYDLALGALEKRPRLKVLLTSGYTSKREEEAKYADNPVVSELAANLLNKPYTKIQLANRIRWALDRED